MAVCVTVGTTKNCDTPVVGGVSEIWLSDRQSILSRTLDVDGAVDVYTMDTGEVFYKFEVASNQTNFVETTQESGEVTQQIVFVLEGRDQEKRNIINRLKKCRCGVTVIHKENTGIYWTWGFDDTDEAKLLTNVSDSGTAKADINTMTVTLQASATEEARQFVGTIPQ